MLRISNISHSALTVTKCFALVIVFLSAVFVQDVAGQNRTMSWSTEFCKFSGTYNSRKYTEAKLRDTLKLFTYGEFKINTSPTVWNHSEIDALDVKKLDDEYAKAKAGLEALDIVKSDFWEAARRSKLNEIEQVYKLSRATMLAYRRPAVLNELDWAPSCKERYVPALVAGGDDLLKVWTDVNVESRGRNADPDRLKRRFDEQNASPNKFEYALVETMAFGWWNCANEFIEYDGQDGEEMQKREAEFKKLFIRVKESECEMP